MNNGSTPLVVKATNKESNHAAAKDENVNNLSLHAIDTTIMPLQQVANGHPVAYYVPKILATGETQCHFACASQSANNQQQQQQQQLFAFDICTCWQHQLH